MVSDSAPSSAGPSVRNNKDDIDPSKSYILTLPTELLTMTVENLTQEDLGMVRRTCKTLCNVATLPFARTMPTARRFRFVEEDMDRLIGLTAHPIFGRMLSCISLSTCRLVQVDDKDLLNKSAKFFRVGTYQPSGILSSREEEHHYQFSQVLAHNKAQELQSRFFMRGLHIENLTKALLNLKVCRNFDVTLGVYDHDDLTELLLNLPFLELSKSARVDDIACALQSLRAAIDMSQFPVKTLDLELRDNHCAGGEIDEQDIFWLKMQPAPDVRVEMTCCETTSVTEISWSKSQIKMTGHSLGSDPMGEGITECNGKPSWLGSKYMELWYYVYFNKYQEAVLTETIADYDTLERFVQSSAFQHLTIRGCDLSEQKDPFGDGTKSSGLTLCRKLKSLASLVSLVLEEIWDCSNEEWIQEEPVRWTGQEQIQAGLDKLAARMSGWEWEG
ncbi:hypothetical protein D6D26_07794 [Aureobasidium pullulans]|nr:hypothetical protein D6D26_07794 [Aureobasidium pullulans]